MTASRMARTGVRLIAAARGFTWILGLGDAVHSKTWVEGYDGKKDAA